MYNTEKKMMFVVRPDAAESSRPVAVTIFNKSEQYELAAKKDLSEMTLDETANMISAMSLRGIQRIRAACTCVNQYREWCGVDQINIRADMIPMDSTVSTFYVDSKELMDRIDSCNGNVVPYLKAFFLCLWCGVPSFYVHNLRMADVTFVRSTVSFHMQGISVRCDDSMIVEWLRDYYDKRMPFSTSLIGSYFINPNSHSGVMKSAPVTQAAISKVTSRCYSGGRPITNQIVFTSGLLHAAYQYELSGKGIVDSKWFADRMFVAKSLRSNNMLALYESYKADRNRSQK